MARVLVVDDEGGIRQLIRRCLQSLGADVLEAATGAEALEQMRRTMPDVVVLDVRLPDMHGLAVLQAIRRMTPDTAVLMLTAFDDSRIAVQAVQQGAEDYMTKPIDVDAFTERIRQLLNTAALRTTARSIAPEATTEDHFYGLVGRSAAMRRVFQWITRVAPTDAPVLITGESGTGKRRIAEVLHRLSRRAQGPFVVVDCSTIPEHLLESELFGYERGAFTGADRQKIGRMEQAQGGTVLLDEIANLPPEGQAKLLHALEEKEIHRLGGLEPIALDVRVMAASNQNLQTLVQDGRFREDLYYRLNVFEIRLPPLRERLEDIPLLAEYFRQAFADRYEKDVRGFRPEVITVFLVYPWPGNVRELRNVVERGVVLADRWIGLEHLPPELQALARTQYPGWFDIDPMADFATRVRQILEETEKRLIMDALTQAEGNRKRAAQLLGVSLRTLYYKMERYGLEIRFPARKSVRTIGSPQEESESEDR